MVGPESGKKDWYRIFILF